MKGMLEKETYEQTVRSFPGISILGENIHGNWRSENVFH